MLIKIVFEQKRKSYKQHFDKKSLAYFYPCRFQQSVSKTSPLLCPFSLPFIGPQPSGIKRFHTLPLCRLRGEGKEGRRLQAEPNQGGAQQGRGSKQLSRSAVSRLDNKEGGDIQAYPRWRHTPSKDQTTRLIWEAHQDLVYKTNIDLLVNCLLVGN
jgi:hypothetical protein